MGNVIENEHRKFNFPPHMVNTALCLAKIVNNDNIVVIILSTNSYDDVQRFSTQVTF